MIGGFTAIELTDIVSLERKFAETRILQGKDNKIPAHYAVLKNHVLYYVSDLAETIEQIREEMKRRGLFLVAMGGSKNAFGKIVEQSFAMIEEPIPYHLEEELELILVGRG
jgi:hypothetical protein